MSEKRKLSGYAQKINEKFIDFLGFYGFSESDFALNPVILGDVCNRYFRDVERLHASHDIKRIDAHKIAGYMTYWITKLKPISVMNLRLYARHAEVCLYINEIFALCFSMGRLFQRKDIDRVHATASLLSAMLYTLKYRTTTGDNLAIMFYLIESGQAKPT